MKYWSGYCSEYLAPKENDINYINVREKPFKIYGLYNMSDENYYRLPVEFAKAVSGGVFDHMKASAGVRVRFATDSPYIAIKAKLNGFAPSPHITYIATKGFDLYIEENGKFTFHNTYNPPLDTDNEVEGITKFKDIKMRNFVLNFPNGTPVISVEIGVKNGFSIFKADKYNNEKPVVFYGSSITQGFAASRPGNTYENFISRKLNIDYINMGFSGSAMGEPVLAEYLSKIPMSAFVMDYDHNAPDVEHLKNTQYDFYKIIRNANVDLPIILVSRPEGRYDEDTLARRKVILDTYTKAIDNGDRNIHFVDGSTFFPDTLRFDCTADGCHPNDLGMYYMAKGILKVLSQINL